MRKTVALTIFLLLFSGWANADQIVLKNGDRLTGKIIKPDGADIGFALTSGNSDTTNLAVGLAMTRETRNDKTTIYAASVYSRDSTDGESRTIANTVRGGLPLKSTVRLREK